MRTLFAVLRTRGSGWDASKPRRSQPLWDEHAAFMDDLTARGVVVLGGPLEGTGDALLIFDAANEAAIRRVLEDDPWSHTHQLETKSIQPWTILLEAPAAARTGGD